MEFGYDRYANCWYSNPLDAITGAAEMSNHNRNISDRSHGRKVNQRNKEIFNFITSLPVGEHTIYVEPDDLPLIKREGSMIIHSNMKWISITQRTPK